MVMGVVKMKVIICPTLHKLLFLQCKTYQYSDIWKMCHILSVLLQSQSRMTMKV